MGFWSWDRRRDGPLLLTLLVVSASINVYLGLRLKRHSSLPLLTRDVTGTYVAGLDVNSLDGHLRRVTFTSDRPVVLYVFRTTCVWCERNYPNIVRLATLLANRYDVVGVSLDSPAVTREYMGRRAFMFPVYAKPSAGSVRLLGMEGTPQTVIIGRNGIVLRSWTGAYIGHIRDDVQRYLKVTLPPMPDWSSM